jgi:hypothetical protein
MNREQFLRLSQRLPNDATEIIIYGHDTSELTFNSDANCTQIGASPAQKGTYKGPKRRWRLTDVLEVVDPNYDRIAATPELQGTKIDLDAIPVAQEPVITFDFIPDEGINITDTIPYADEE